MNRNSGVSTNNSETLNKSNGTFNFHTPTATATNGQGSDDDSYQTVNEDDYSDEDDDDYEPIEMAAWGDSAAKTSELASWSNLIDPSIKVKAGGVGSGNLHRRGGNFKPVSEDYIIAQRLKKGVSTKKPGSKSRGGKKKKASSATSGPPIRPPVRPTVAPRRAVVVPRLPVRQRSANAPPLPWGAAPLVETPFWEIKKEPVAVPAAPVSNIKPLASNLSVNPLPSKPTTNVSSRIIVTATSISATIKKTPTTSPTASTTTSTTTTNIPKFNPNAEGFTPLSKNFASPSWNGGAATFNPNVPSFIPSPVLAHTPTTASSSNSSSTLTSSSPAKTVFNTNVPDFLPFVQLSVKKPVKITTPTDAPTAKITTPQQKETLTPKASVPKPNLMTNPLLRKQLQNINSGLSSNQPSHKAPAPAPVPVATTQPAPTAQPAPPATTPSTQHLSMESQTGPKSTRGLEEPKPLVQINMELAPGISTEILVYENSDPMQLAEEFGIKHHLNVTNTAKANIARNINHLLTTKKAALGL